MGSETLVLFPGSGNPWLWLGLAAFFSGLGVLCALRAIWGRGGRRARVRLSVQACLALALAVLAGAAFLVLTDKSLPEPLVLAAWTGLLLIAGACLGAWPKPVLPLLVIISLGLAWGLDQLMAGWLPLKGEATIARLYPFEVGNKGFTGELELFERDSVPTLQRLELAESELSLVVERLELSGPLTIFAAPANYRVVALAGPTARILVAFPGGEGLADRLLPLLGEGPAEASLPLLRHSRELSQNLALVASEPVLFGFQPKAGGFVLGIETAARGSLPGH